MVVLLWHSTLATRFGDSILGQLSGWPAPPRDDAGRILFDTPLRLLTMGTPAVTVFFVLSGVVLVLPLLRGGLDLWAYYPRRVLRLWLPCAASVALALLLMAAIPQRPEDAVSVWAKTFSFPEVDLSTALSSFFLVTRDPMYNNPLWSVKWEMLFSLLLPVVFLVVVGVRRHPWAAIVCCAGLSGWGAVVAVGEVQYVPMFLAGGFIAVLVHRRRPRRAPLSWVLIVGGILLICVPDMYRTLLGGLPYETVGLALTGSVVLGAAVLIRGLTVRSSASRLFESRPMRFLGRISFSLYLVHVPLLLAMVHIVPGHPLWAVAMGIPLSLFVATLFARFVEEPSASLAKRAGERASARAAAQITRA